MYQNSNVESRSFMDPSTGRPNQITEEFVKHCEVSWVPDSVMVTQRRMPRCPILAGLFNCHGTCRAGIAIPGAIELPREKFDNNAAVLEHLFMGHRIPVRVPEPGSGCRRKYACVSSTTSLHRSCWLGSAGSRVTSCGCSGICVFIA